MKLDSVSRSSDDLRRTRIKVGLPGKNGSGKILTNITLSIPLLQPIEFPFPVPYMPSHYIPESTDKIG